MTPLEKWFAEHVVPHVIRVWHPEIEWTRGWFDQPQYYVRLVYTRMSRSCTTPDKSKARIYKSIEHAKRAADQLNSPHWKFVFTVEPIH